MVLNTKLSKNYLFILSYQMKSAMQVLIILNLYVNK